MHDDTSNEMCNDEVAIPYEPPGVFEIVLKGLMGVLGVIGVLGYVRWMESGYESGYRVGSAAIGMLCVVNVVWAVLNGDWRQKRVGILVRLVLGVVVLVGSFSGSP